MTHRRPPQALALSADYEPARKNLANLTRIPPSKPKRKALRSLWVVLTKSTPKAEQNKKQQTELFIFLILSSLCSLTFPTLYAVVWPLITGVSVIAIGYATVSYLLGDKLSDYARPSTPVVSLLITQLFRLMITLWVDELSIIPLLDLLVILSSGLVILWLIFRPDLSAYLAIIVVAVSVFLYQTGFLLRAYP